MKRLSRLRLIPTNLNHQTKVLLDNSTIHGVRYMNENGRVSGEKFLWFSCVAIGFVAAMVIIDSLWEKFQTNPTITGLDTDFHNQEFTFPTVAICPIFAVDADKVNRTAQMIASDSDEDFEKYFPFLEMLPSLTYDDMTSAFTNISTSLSPEEFQRTNKYTLRQLVFNVSLECKDLFDTCMFRDEAIECCDHFTPSYNEQGFCYSFNGRHKSSAFDEVQMKQDDVISETDRRWELQMKLRRKSKAFLHSSDDVTSFEMIALYDLFESENVESLISMRQTYTTDDARQLTKKQRKCIFENEVDLKYYRNDTYSLSVCMIKCRMQKALKLCNCIPPFYAPVGESWWLARSCKSTSETFSCLMRHRRNITSMSGCSHCDLSCTTTIYETEKFTLSFSNKTSRQDADGGGAAATIDDDEEFFHVTVEFLSWPIIRYKKEVLFGWVDLLVSFGGIAGLFLGFSLLSGVEIIYFYTMRTCCMFVKNREHLYKLQEEKDSRPLITYDLGLKPTFISSGNGEKSAIDKGNKNGIRMVRPVEPDNHDDNSSSNNVRLSTRKKTMNNLFSTNEEITRPDLEFNPAPFTLSYPTGGDGGEGRIGRKLARPQRRNMFANNADPYNSVMKPLDRNFWAHRRRGGIDGGSHQHEPFYYGYLP